MSRETERHWDTCHAVERNPKKLRARVFNDTRPTAATLYDHLADAVHGSELCGD